jgi:hypothetical protein
LMTMAQMWPFTSISSMSKSSGRLLNECGNPVEVSQGGRNPSSTPSLVGKGRVPPAKPMDHASHDLERTSLNRWNWHSTKS